MYISKYEFFVSSQILHLDLQFCVPYLSLHDQTQTLSYLVCDKVQHTVAFL
jgi:hypothetical protein